MGGRRLLTGRDPCVTTAGDGFVARAQPSVGAMSEVHEQPNSRCARESTSRWPVAAHTLSVRELQVLVALVRRQGAS